MERNSLSNSLANKAVLMGNEAIARGALEAGVQVATAYPGTPSSEVLEALARHAAECGVYVEWSTNEKVALEVAAGAAYAGLRSMAVMKQVGLNVAADPLMSLAYIGVKGGMVVVVADDPGPHSSQTEQDTRLFARFARLPVFDPATPAEAKEMVKAAFDLSEEVGLPVILRPTTRVSHVSQDVELGEIPKERRKGKFEKDPGWVIMPGLAFKRHQHLEMTQERLREIFASSPFNRAQGEADCGVICSGVSCSYVEEAVSALGLKLAVLKIGTPYPLPTPLVSDFLRVRKTVLVVEEQDPVVEEQVIFAAWKEGLKVAVHGKHNGVLPRAGEFNVETVVRAFAACGFIDDPAATGAHKAVRPKESLTTSKQSVDIPERPPALCPGCPHRASFYAVKEAARGTDAVYTGDIGCYTLGLMPPLQMVDTCLCMGASIGIACGLYRSDPGRPHIAFLGDSTFFHAGVPALINAVYNNERIVLVILDNSTTAMTGFQPHPGTGKTAAGSPAEKVSLASLVRGCGVKWVREVDPFDLEKAKAAVREALSQEAPAVLIMKRECVWIRGKGKTYTVDGDACTGCGGCIDELGCPALVRSGDTAQITEDCTGCGVCSQICPAAAIKENR